jgi:hypothetical protein
MPKWLAVTQLVVEAETEEEANTLVAAKLAEHLPTAESGQHETVGTPRHTVINIERLPDYTDSASQQHG